MIKRIGNNMKCGTSNLHSTIFNPIPIVMYQDTSIGDSLLHDVLLCEKVYLCVVFVTPKAI